MADNQKDLDFDELHQAVNALMDQTQNGKKPASDSPRPAAAAPGDKPKPPPPKVEPDSDHISVTVKRPLPPVTMHRSGRGRAMDVVGPRPAPKLAPPSERPKRDAPTLQPTQEVKPEPATLPVQTAHAPVADKKEEPSDDMLASINMKDEPAPHTMTHQKAAVSEPVEPEKSKEQANEVMVAEPAPTLEPKPEEPKEPAVAAEDSEDAATPFVTTKVEKRPLGAYADSEPPKEAEPGKAAGEKPKADAKEAEKDAPAPLTNQNQPAELSPEVVAVESAMSPEMTDEAEAPGVDGLRNMSIPHQYKEADKAEDSQSRPVFDTKEYHPPLQAPHHGASHSKSSMGGWIMGISLVALLLIALGFIYYMINGSLDLSLLFS